MGSFSILWLVLFGIVAVVVLGAIVTLVIVIAQAQRAQSKRLKEFEFRPPQR